MSSRGRVWWAAAAAAVTVALAGCGSGSSSANRAGAAQRVVDQFGHTGRCTLLTPAARDELAGETAAAACQKTMDAGTKPKYSIESATVSGSRGTVKVHGTEGEYTIHLVHTKGTWLIDRVEQPSDSSGGSDTATSTSPSAGSALSVPVTDATAARDTLLQVARTASYAPDPSDPYATVDAVFKAWQAHVPTLQIGAAVDAATPSQVSAYHDYVTDKSSGDSVLWFTVTDTSNRCAAGAIAMPPTAGSNDPPTIFEPIAAANLPACEASALITVGMPVSTP